MHFMSMETTLWIAENLPQVTQLLRTLCAIPAPSGKEEQRAAFCEKWLTDAGVPGVFTDEALNVICPIHDDGGPVTIVMAHTDTVFPDLSPMPFTEDDTRLCSPGVGDDTANLALLMTAARYLVEEKVPLNSGLVLVCNSCEEGLGNLKGCRAVMVGDREIDVLSGRNAGIDGILVSGTVPADTCARYVVRRLAEITGESVD